MAKRIIFEPSRALAEFRLLPGYTEADARSEKISLSSTLTQRIDSKQEIKLNIPMLAAAMQSVSGVRMAVELARQGGMAFIYASQSIEEQAEMVRRVKNHKAGFVKPRIATSDLLIRELVSLANKCGFSTFPVIDDNGIFLGLITKNDFDIHAHADLKVMERMICKQNLVLGRNVSSLKQANEILIESHQSVLPILDDDDRLLFLVFRKDIEDHLDNPHEIVDSHKRLMTGAAVNTHDYEDRVKKLIEAEVDVLSVDSSDGHSFFQKAVLEWLKNEYPTVPVIGGNIVTGAGFRFLVDAGADAVKIGMGGGSICITQEQKGTGRGLATAIIDVTKARDEYYHETGRYIPLIADGGIVHAKDMAVAIALGADNVMLGRYFARMEESPTEKVMINNRVMKPYWGEGSLRAREWRKNRYGQNSFAEGVEGYVEYAGKMKDNLVETLAILKSTLSSCGSASIRHLHETAVLEVVSALSIREGQIHDIFMPDRTDNNYRSKAWG